jgi:predicted DNA-binding ribbon-helix-helix protein
MLPLPIGSRKSRAKGKNAQVRQQASSSTMGEILERSVLEPPSCQLNGMFTGLTMHENNGCDLMNVARTRKLHVSAILDRLKLKSRVQAALLSSELLQNDS